MVISWQSAVTAASVLAALAALWGYVSRLLRWLDRQDRQDEALKKLKAEQTILLRGILACLQGLQEQGCDGPVKAAVQELQEYLIRK